MRRRVVRLVLALLVAGLVLSPTPACADSYPIPRKGCRPVERAEITERTQFRPPDTVGPQEIQMPGQDATGGSLEGAGPAARQPRPGQGGPSSFRATGLAETPGGRLRGRSPPGASFRGALLQGFAAVADPPNGLNPEKHGGLLNLYQHLHPSTPTP